METINLEIPRMTTIKAAANLFDLPEHTVRAFARQDQNGARLFTVMIGKKYLINVERFTAYLNGAFFQPVQQQAQAVDGITPVAVGR